MLHLGLQLQIRHLEPFLRYRHPYRQVPEALLSKLLQPKRQRLGQQSQWLQPLLPCRLLRSLQQEQSL